MDKLLQKENNINYSNKQSALDSNNNRFFFYNNGNYFSFGKDNTLINKSAPNTSSFNIKESLKNNYANDNNSNSFLNKKRKLMTSEELELEQIERERKEVKKMMRKNMALYYKTKSGTTTIISKIRDDIYGSNNNINRNTALLSNYIKSNNKDRNSNKYNFPINPIINKNNSYAMNFLKVKERNNEAKKIISTNKNINKTEITYVQPKKEIIEIINTDSDINNNISFNNENVLNKENNLNLEGKKEKHEDKIAGTSEEENDNQLIENFEKEEDNSDIKTPNKESLYLTKIKKLGSMSKLSLYKKIQTFTEICQEVLKEQKEVEESIKERVKIKINQKSKKKNKKGQKKK